MKKYILYGIICFLAFKGNAQNFNSVSFSKTYKEVKVQSKEDTSLNTVLKKDVIIVDSLLPRVEKKIRKFDEITDLKNNINYQMDLFSTPLDNMEMTSNYGMRFHPIKRVMKFHSGVDFRANNDTIKAILNGIVEESGYNQGLGYFIKVRHDRYIVIYGHLNQYFYLKGQRVISGQPIGITGNTGLSTGPHLHFAVKYDGESINPIKFLNNLIELNNKIAYLNEKKSRNNSNRKIENNSDG